MSNQLKLMNKTYNNLMLSSGVFSKTLSHNTFRTSKDRVNPFMTMKPEMII